jgi:hypothetical protein
MGDEGEATLGTSFTERFGSGGAQNQGSPAAAVVQRERERERGKREQRKKKEQEGLGPNWYRDKGVSLLSAVLRYKGASEPTDVVCSSNLAGSIGRHHPWCPSMHRGRQDD